MQWHPSYTHIHVIHCTTETSRPSELSELLALTHPQSTFPAAQTRARTAPALPITDIHGQKKRKNLQAYVSHSWSWTRRVPMGTHFLMASLQPYSICPCKMPPAQLPHFWLSDPTQHVSNFSWLSQSSALFRQPQ